LFDRAILEELIKADLPVGSLLPEKYYTKMEMLMDEFLGIHPTKKEQIINISRSIVTLSEMGNCIIVGRGANIITAGKPSGLHIRIIAAEKTRLKNIRKKTSITVKEAEKYLLSEDKNRAAYIKKVFAKDINDPLLYDLVLRTDDISYEDAAEMIGKMAMKKYVFN
jgi:cytidylate kinase